MDITLALGGGGVRGNSHIGVIRRLEQVGVRIRGVAGTSFGGIVGVPYAGGYSADDIEEIFCGLEKEAVRPHARGRSLADRAGRSGRSSRST